MLKWTRGQPSSRQTSARFLTEKAFTEKAEAISFSQSSTRLKAVVLMTMEEKADENLSHPGEVENIKFGAAKSVERLFGQQLLEVLAELAPGADERDGPIFFEGALSKL